MRPARSTKRTRKPLRGLVVGSKRLGSPARCAKRRRLTSCSVASPSRSLSLTTEAKAKLRRVLRLVHPDRYMREVAAREVNSRSLQALNAYTDSLARGERGRCTAQSLRFLVHPEGGSHAPLREVVCSLPAGGSLQPLFSAFASLAQAVNSPQPTPSPPRTSELLEWLSSNLGESTARREHSETRAQSLEAAKRACEAEFGLQRLHLGFLAESASAQASHLEALAAALRCLSVEALRQVRGAHIVVADAQEVPQQPGRALAEAPGMRLLLASDGTLWLSLCSDWRPIWRFLRSIDLAWASEAGAAAAQAAAKAQDELPALAMLLRVRYLFAPSALRPEPLAGFCAALRQAAPALEAAAPAEAFAIGLHVCAELAAGPWDLAWSDERGVLCCAYAFGHHSVMVSAQCPPWALSHFLAQHGARCDAERAAGEEVRARLERTQAAVKEALGVALGFSVRLPDIVALASADRLLLAAPELTAAVGTRVRGTRILVTADSDPCAYELLSNGTICLPASFRIDLLVRAILDCNSGPA